MRVWILRQLRREARAWWAHRELRTQQQPDEAAKRERAAMRSGREVICKALATTDATVSTGRGGTTVHFSRGATLSSYGRLDQMATARILVHLRLPFIDTHPVEPPWPLISLPMVAVGIENDDPPWHALAYAPLAVYAARAQELRTVRNLNLRSPAPLPA